MSHMGVLQARRSLVALLLVVTAGTSCGTAIGRGSSRDHAGVASTTTTTGAPAGTGSTTANPCTILTRADIAAATKPAYDAGLQLTRPDGSLCVYRRADGVGEISLTLFTQDKLDAAVAQDRGLAYSTLRELLEYTKTLAETGASTYVAISDLGDGGYEMHSTDVTETDRLAVIDGDNLAIIAVTDPTVKIDVVRRWMAQVLARL
jgi:hypothetical protein